ncbi:MAG: M48 family metalloprotease [Elusimicrobia bacterium]|nr:M48 family metalloprotease [Elusimicrobiota bacterium]
MSKISIAAAWGCLIVITALDAQETPPGVYDFNPEDPPRSVVWYDDARQETERVFNRLLKALRRRRDYRTPTKLAYGNPDITGENPAANCLLGRCDPNVALVGVHPMLFDIVRNEHELALVMAHEFAHLKLGHNEIRIIAMEGAPETAGRQALHQLIWDQEKEADLQAVPYMRQAGFRCAQARRVFRHFADYLWAVRGKTREDVKRFFEKSRTHETPEERERLFLTLCPEAAQAR